MRHYPTGVLLRPDSRRVVVRPFISTDPLRVGNIIGRALALDEDEVEEQLSLVRADFRGRHIDLDKSWLRHFEKVQSYISNREELTLARKLFIGALFSGEYALESAALFNPSIVPHPDQRNLSPGELRFILSLRSTGEGHISSIQFRTGSNGDAVQGHRCRSSILRSVGRSRDASDAGADGGARRRSIHSGARDQAGKGHSECSSRECEQPIA